MRIVTDLNAYRSRSSERLVLAIGNFDGFHVGHQKLLAYVSRQAKKMRVRAAVLTFRNHPQSVLHPEKKQRLLHSIEQKFYYLSKTGIDLCIAPRFTAAFSKMSPEDFVRKVLVKRLRVREVCMGYDAHFGYHRRGTTEMMKQLAKRYSFIFKKMIPVIIDGEPVSSSYLRDLISQGKVEKAARCLGRPFSLFGEVVHGKGHGTYLGAPTANVEVHANIQLPRGAYVASARLLPKSFERIGNGNTIRLFPEIKTGKWFSGVINYGKRPTYPASETPKPVLEAHLFGFHDNVYGRYIEIALRHFIRAEKRFASEETLRQQIVRDIVIAKRWHNSHLCRKKPFTNPGG